jgi:hypothetical protein
MKDKVEVTKEFLQRVEDALSINPTSAHGLAVRKELETIVGGWKPLAGTDFKTLQPADLMELRSSDGRTGSLGVIVSLPGQDILNCIAVIDQRDGIPVFVPWREFSGWRPYELPEDPS